MPYPHVAPPNASPLGKRKEDPHSNHQKKRRKRKRKKKREEKNFTCALLLDVDDVEEVVEQAALEFVVAGSVGRERRARIHLDEPATQPQTVRHSHTQRDTETLRD
eukprot:1707925-Rhodomonas_salina.2